MERERISKQVFVKMVASRVKESNENITLKTVEEITNLVFDTIVDLVLKGNEVFIREFGKFYLQDVAGRVARNPKTGKEMRLPERKKFAFKASKKILFPEGR